MEQNEVPVEEKCHLEVVQCQKTMQILGPENWEKILSSLPPNDFLSGINSCPDLAQVMRSKTPRILLPLILPKLAKHLPSSTLLNFRKISQQGKVITDELLKRGQKLINLEPIFESYTFDSLEKVVRFNQRMEGRPFPSENPFVISSICVRFPPAFEEWDDQDDFGMQDELILLLERFGKYVRSLTFVGFPLDDGRLEILFLLLSQLPNLAALTIKGLVVDVDEQWLTSVVLPPYLYWLQHLELGKVTAGQEHLPCVEALCIRLLRQCGPSLYYASLPGDMMRVETRPALIGLNSTIPNVKILHLYNVDNVTCKLLENVTWQLEELRFLKLQPIDDLNGWVGGWMLPDDENDNHVDTDEDWDDVDEDGDDEDDEEEDEDEDWDDEDEDNDDVGEGAINEAADDAGPFGATVPEFLEVAGHFSNTLVSLDLFPAIRFEDGVPPEWLYRDFNPENMVVLSNLESLDLEFYNVHLDWLWKFLKRSCCRTLETLSLHSPETEIVAKDHVLMASTIAFRSVDSLKKVIVYNNVNADDTYIITVVRNQ